MTAPRPRVVLVEDNVSIAQFVELALEDLPIELVMCTHVAEALQTLEQQPTRLLITDLMLPGESGMVLIERLARRTRGLDGLRVAVLSAGLTPEVRAQLQALQVWRLLSKPVSLAEIERCVLDALQDAPVELPAAAPAPIAAPSDEAGVIDRHFAGDAELFYAYRDSCLRQFPADVQAGDAAVVARDWGALTRLAHSLATVLTTLGRPEAGQMARRLEEIASEAGPVCTDCVAQWAALRSRIPVTAD